jgi:hypothetical protein
MRLSVPKVFASGIRIPNGPLAGQLAMPCSCGQPFEDSDRIVVVVTPDGEFYMFHAEHAPGGVTLMEGD